MRPGGMSAPVRLAAGVVAATGTARLAGDGRGGAGAGRPEPAPSVTLVHQASRPGWDIRHRPSSGVALIPAVEAGLLPWRLPTPISREVLLSGRRPTADGRAAARYRRRSRRSPGSTAQAAGNVQSATLPAGVHDAAGAWSSAAGDRCSVADPRSTVAGVESFRPGLGPRSSGPFPGRRPLIGQLPRPARTPPRPRSVPHLHRRRLRRDHADPAVLATTDGPHSSPWPPSRSGPLPGRGAHVRQGCLCSVGQAVGRPSVRPPGG